MVLIRILVCRSDTAMDNQAIPGNGLSTLRNPHPSSHPLRPPGTSFDLGRLPCELRTLVIRAAEVLHTEDCRHLLLVNREFHQVVSPHHWSVSPTAAICNAELTPSDDHSESSSTLGGPSLSSSSWSRRFSLGTD